MNLCIIYGRCPVEQIWIQLDLILKYIHTFIYCLTYNRQAFLNVMYEIYLYLTNIMYCACVQQKGVTISLDQQQDHSQGGEFLEYSLCKMYN